jgi:hypothetical protein
MDDIMMKKEYDFSKGVRGKFYRPKVKLRLPIYLEDDVARVFPDAKAVNSALRYIIAAMPKKVKEKTS